jgi:hypothetical protein
MFLMQKHGSDKGGPRHCYTKYYNELFSPMQENEWLNIIKKLEKRTT